MLEWDDSVTPARPARVRTALIFADYDAGMYGWRAHADNRVCRVAWTSEGTAAVVMPWQTTPHTSRPVTAALTVLTWTFLSAFAMRGLTLRHPIRVARPAKVVVRPEIHVQVTAPAAPSDDHPHHGCPFRD